MEDFRTIGKRLSNWGRWGPDDERGTVNFITAERLVAAAGLVSKGQIFDLGIALDGDGPQLGGALFNPMRFMGETGSNVDGYGGAFRYAMDYLFMPTGAASQWDALAHVHYDGKLYNGYPGTEITVRGARRDSIDKLSKGIAGRGVLLDIAARRGVDWLSGGEVITPEDLEAAAEGQGVEVRSGDILLVRTGWRKKLLTDGDRAAFMASEPGLGMACAEWLHSREVAAVACDNWAVEVLPGEYPDEVFPLHMVLLRDMGMTLGEILDFEELAADCAADGVYEFLLAGPPLKLTNALTSPINPLAIK